jgi:hypothetical protein
MIEERCHHTHQYIVSFHTILQARTRQYGSFGWLMEIPSHLAKHDAIHGQTSFATTILSFLFS